MNDGNDVPEGPLRSSLAYLAVTVPCSTTPIDDSGSGSNDGPLTDGDGYRVG